MADSAVTTLFFVFVVLCTLITAYFSRTKVADHDRKITGFTGTIDVETSGERATFCALLERPCSYFNVSWSSRSSDWRKRRHEGCNKLAMAANTRLLHPRAGRRRGELRNFLLTQIC